jgi:predicted nucleic acid-binding protein
MYLLDTNVISELRKPRPHGAVLAWIATLQPNQWSLPAIVIGELQQGIELTRRQDAGKARELEQWLEGLLLRTSILPMSAEVCREWARLMDGKSQDLFADAMIAATARVRALTVVTRNTSDFVHFEVSIYSPFLDRRGEER